MDELKPCPFCGGKVFLQSRYETISHIDTDVLCAVCGMTFSHSQDFAHSGFVRVPIKASFEEVWNRRVNDAAD